MRSFSSTYRLQGFSVKDIALEFEDATLRIAKQHTFNGRKLKPGPLLNAIVLWFLRLPEEERMRFSGEWIAHLEAFLAETDDEREAARRRVAGVPRPEIVVEEIVPPELPEGRKIPIKKPDGAKPARKRPGKSAG